MKNFDEEMDEYIWNHIQSGIKVGDYVKVTRKREHNEDGCQSGWIDEMDWLVGGIFKVTDDLIEEGFEIFVGGCGSGTYLISYAVLEKITTREEIKDALFVNTKHKSPTIDINYPVNLKCVITFSKWIESNGIHCITFVLTNGSGEITWRYANEKDRDFDFEKLITYL